MAAATAAATASPFDLRSTSLTLTALVLRSADVGAVADALRRRYGDAQGLFDGEALLIDLMALPADGPALDLQSLLQLLRGQGFRPLAVRCTHEALTAAAEAAGLLALPEALAPPPAASARGLPEAPAADDDALAAAAGTALGAAPEAEPAPAEGPAPAAGGRTLLIDRPLRSGQQVYARGGDLVVLAPVSFGAEVIADGHIHVYAPLRGRAIAGARGDAAARIFSTCMEPQLVAVAGTYRTVEDALPAEVAGQAAQVRLDGERLVFEPLAR